MEDGPHCWSVKIDANNLLKTKQVISLRSYRADFILPASSKEPQRDEKRYPLYPLPFQDVLKVGKSTKRLLTFVYSII